MVHTGINGAEHSMKARTGRDQTATPTISPLSASVPRSKIRELCTLIVGGKHRAVVSVFADLYKADRRG
jgi:hypothetical protein